MEENYLTLHDIGLLRLQLNKEIYTIDMIISTGNIINKKLNSLGIEPRDFLFDQCKFSVTVPKEKEEQTSEVIYDSINEYFNLHHNELLNVCYHLFGQNDTTVDKYNYMMNNIDLLLKEEVIPISEYSSDIEVSILL